MDEKFTNVKRDSQIMNWEKVISKEGSGEVIAESYCMQVMSDYVESGAEEGWDWSQLEIWM